MSLFLKQFIVYQAPYSLLIFLIFFYFLILYFGGGFLFDKIAAFLEQRKWLHRITQKVVTPIQIRFEIKHSVVSMFMFGISGSILIALIRAKIFLLATDTWMNLLIGVTILNIWNEVYFFIIHRLLHVPFLMRHIHWIHHRSVVPTVYSVPYDFDFVKDDLFLKHDLNLYNFVINVNKQLKEKNIVFRGKSDLDMSMITEHQFKHIDFPNRWTNILDLRSAIEVFTPFYQLFLTANDFVRASNSLQLDETIAIYSSKILNSPAHLGLVNNRHPMVPVTTYSAAYRLVLHGLAAETLHAILVSIKLKKDFDGVIVTK